MWTANYIKHIIWVFCSIKTSTTTDKFKSKNWTEYGHVYYILTLLVWKNIYIFMTRMQIYGLQWFKCKLIQNSPIQHVHNSKMLAKIGIYDVLQAVCITYPAVFIQYVVHWYTYIILLFGRRPILWKYVWTVINSSPGKVIIFFHVINRRTRDVLGKWSWTIIRSKKNDCT